MVPIARDLSSNQLVKDINQPSSGVILSISLVILVAVEPLKRLGSLELDLPGVGLIRPRWGNAPSLLTGSLREVPLAIELVGLLLPCAGFVETTLT